MSYRNIKVKYRDTDYIYYEGSSGYIQNEQDWHDEWFIPPTLRDIIKDLPEDKAESLLLAVLYIYDLGINKGIDKFKKNFINTFANMFDLNIKSNGD